jgi:hypothetical protein
MLHEAKKIPEKFYRLSARALVSSSKLPRAQIMIDEETAQCDIWGKTVSRPEKATSCLDYWKFADKSLVIINSQKK